MRKTNLFILVTIAIQLEKLISVINIVMLFQVSFLSFQTLFLTKNTPSKTFKFHFCLQSTEKAIKIIIASMIFSNLI